MTTSRPLALAALALATTMTMAACSSSNGSPAEEPTTSSSATASPTTASSAPTVPSDWQTVTLRDVAELSVPSDWNVKSLNASQHTLNAPLDASGLPAATGIASAGNLAGGDPEKALESAAKWSMENDYSGYSNLKRLPNEVINGTTFYRLQLESEATWFDVYGTVTPDAEYHILIEWRADKIIDRQEAEAIWSPVMPTFRML
ncbi:hypothetical protein WBG06_10600 [Nocardioides sp. CCNWLW239]|uniref:hypothetical protein n=1 Tax=Nocardioides sp. CCNWLW239 TaxID=3128902 RepID=UPI003018C197